jgi:hypothetical protein
VITIHSRKKLQLLRPPKYLDRTRISVRELELKYKIKRHMGQSRRRLFSQVLEGVGKAERKSRSDMLEIKKGSETFLLSTRIKLIKS